MKNKFKMPLTWHNCKTYPPSEDENPSLIITNGKDVFGVKWHKEKGYYASYDDEDKYLDPEAYEYWWWADLEQTVRGCSEFKDGDYNEV